MRDKQIYIMAIKLSFPFLEILFFCTHPAFVHCLFTSLPFCMLAYCLISNVMWSTLLLDHLVVLYMFHSYCEIGSLNSIIKPSSSDLAEDGLFITRRKLGGTATPVIFYLQIHLLLDSSNNRLPYTSFCLNLAHRISFWEKRNDDRMFRRRYWLHGMLERKNDGWCWFQHAKYSQTISHDLV